MREVRLEPGEEIPPLKALKEESKTLLPQKENALWEMIKSSKESQCGF